MKKIILGLAISLLFIGCGESVIDSNDNTRVGLLTDAAVENVDYDCLADNEYNKVTGENGEFFCKDMSNVQFRIGKLILGSIQGFIGEDNHIYPQDLLAIDREQGLEDFDVLTMAMLLQSLDEDGNVKNGIQIGQEIRHLFNEEEYFSLEYLEEYLDKAGIPEERRVNLSDAQEHLRGTYEYFSQDLPF